MTYLLQFCGFSDPLQLFYLEQSAIGTAPASREAPAGSGGLEVPGPGPGPGAAAAGPAFGGFRPFQLDDLLAWALDTARQRQWDSGVIQRTVLDCWMERAEAIRQWQRRLREEPSDRLLVAGLGSQHDWQRRCEAMLRA